MTLGRLTGDTIVRRIGPKRVIIAGGFARQPALRSRRLSPVWEAAIIGFALVGVGCSNIVPVLYTAVGRQTVMPEHAAVPVISTLGYAGILAGPAAIGFIAHGMNLSVALLVVAVMMVAVAASGKARLIV